MKNYSLIICLAILLIGCRKDKPKAGAYIGTFSYDEGTVAYTDITISDVEKHHLKINGFGIKKEGKRIYGTLYYLDFSNGSFEIDGKWSHAPFSSVYTIEGDFIHTQSYLNGQSYTFTGTFKIKPK